MHQNAAASLFDSHGDMNNEHVETATRMLFAMKGTERRTREEYNLEVEKRTEKTPVPTTIREPFSILPFSHTKSDI
jgi:hypothetical protein